MQAPSLHEGHVITFRVALLKGSQQMAQSSMRLGIQVKLQNLDAHCYRIETYKYIATKHQPISVNFIQHVSRMGCYFDHYRYLLASL